MDERQALDVRHEVPAATHAINCCPRVTHAGLGRVLPEHDVLVADVEGAGLVVRYAALSLRPGRLITLGRQEKLK
jgi:hypothetical protein